ncbi:MAG: acetyl-CoA synthetase [Trebonia sp.]|nr:acetyl-CoA synthetase [Trebonia sp.]
MELALPLPADDTPLDGWRPLLDELLLDPFDELLDEPVDPLELVPEFEVALVDELELGEDLLPVLVVAAWLDPGSITATTPATATLASDTVVVVAFSRRRPRSRSATARATCRPASWSVPQLFTLTSVTRPAVNAVVELSANVLSARQGVEHRAAGVCGRGRNCQYLAMRNDASPHASGPGALRAARDLLVAHRTEYTAAVDRFAWPALDEFNWALDWFDVIAAEHPDRLALRVVGDDGSDEAVSYAAMAARSSRVANWLRGLGVRRGDHVLLMLGNIVPLWEVMLAAMKLGAVVIPASTLLQPGDLEDRIARGRVRHVIAEAAHTPRFAGISGDWTRVVVGGDAAPGGTATGSTATGSTATGSTANWRPYADSATAPAEFTPEGTTRAGDPLLLYFTSGTTSKPKLVGHTHVSYPVGHLSTMYWIGIQPGDVHLNISSPGWAKHAWSNFFAPWNASATILILNQSRFNAQGLLKALGDCGVTTFCAPPTVWRMLIQADLHAADISVLRECVAAGEPLNPEVIDQVSKAWGITVRDGFGQTETTALVGNPPGQPVKPGSMGRPLPGYPVVLVDPVTGAPGRDGEICLDLARRPLGLMTGYAGDAERDAEAMRGGYYHTGDVATKDEEGYITYVGRTDDVFKASDYRISPFELESVLIEHVAVAEAAVVPAPDPLRLAVPKAYVLLAAGATPGPELARDIMAFVRERVPGYKRIRRVEFGDLPKTISGKIRRVELRAQESDPRGGRGVTEFWEEDFAW